MSFTRWIALFGVITMGVTAGNLASNFITLKIAEIELNAELEKAKVENALRKAREQRELEQQRELRDRQAQQRREQQERQRREAERRRSVQQQLESTCNFWISEYSKSRSEADRNNRDMACRQAGRPFN